MILFRLPFRPFSPGVLSLACGLMAIASHARLVIVGETVQRSSVAPGASFGGTITVLNRGTEPQEVRVYTTDYRFVANGENDYGAPGSHARSNAKWFTVEASQLSLAPGATVDIAYRGSVPAGQDPGGTYWSLIMVEQTEPVSAPVRGTDPSERKAAIRTVVRHAIQIVTDLGAPSPAELRVLGRNLEADSESRLMTLDVENGGAWMVRPDVTLELFDRSGATVTKVAAARVRLYPTCSYRYRFDLRGVPAGRYTALVVLDSGDDQLAGAQYALDLP